MSTETKAPNGTLLDPHARCLVCRAPQPADTQTRTGTGNWWFLDYPSPWPRRVRPFCSRTCCDAFKAWPRDEQLRAMFGTADLAHWLITAVSSGELRPDRPDAGGVAFVPQFERLPIGDFYACPDPMLLEREGDESDSFCMGCARQALLGYREIPVPAPTAERKAVSA